MGKRDWQWSRSVRRAEGKENGGGAAAAGCMSGVLHFLDFHQLLFTTTGNGGKSPAAISSSPRHHHHLPPVQPKGVDAPRNSLEVDQGSTVPHDEYFDIPVGIQITVPAAAGAKVPTLEEERRSTNVATPRTPNLVARLMGLTVLPDESPSPASTYKSKSVPCSASPTPPMVQKVHVHSRCKKKKKQNVDENSRRESFTPPRRPLQNRNGNIEMASRSLPDTPRVSSARPSWDVDHRLSLQINKENNFVSEEQQSPLLPSLAKPRKKMITKNQMMEEIKSPRNYSYASEIVKQVKENISSRRAENVVRSVRTRPTGVAVEPWKPPPACAPPTTSRFLEPTQKLKWLGNEDKTIKPRPPKPSRPKPTISFSPTSTRSSKFTEKITKQRPTAASSTASSLTSAGTVNVRSTQSLQSFVTVHRKELSTTSATQWRQYSNTIVNGVECALRPSPKQSSRQCRLQKEIDPEFHYVKSVLLLAGILTKPLPCFRWYSPTRPVDPVIFQKLELQFPYNTDISDEFKWNSLPLGPLKHRWNRKLLFHLVQEILPEISEYHRHRGKDCRERRRLSNITDGESVLQKLWTDIRSFPEADCRVAGDIDALVDGDLQEANVRRLLLHPSLGEEAEELAVVIQKDILDSVLKETAASLVRAVPES